MSKVKGKRLRVKGFSLVEMLVVIMVFSILAILSTQTLLYSLRGARKSEALGIVRENVDFASSTMERLLRNAQEITLCNNVQVDYLDEFNNEGRFRCDLSGGYIASGSASPVNLTSPEVFIICNEPGKPTFNCPPPASIDVPPSVEINVVGRHSTSGTTSEGAKVTSSTKVLLRNY